MINPRSSVEYSGGVIAVAVTSLVGLLTMIGAAAIEYSAHGASHAFALALPIAAAIVCLGALIAAVIVLNLINK